MEQECARQEEEEGEEEEERAAEEGRDLADKQTHK